MEPKYRPSVKAVIEVLDDAGWRVIGMTSGSVEFMRLVCLSRTAIRHGKLCYAVRVRRRLT